MKLFFFLYWFQFSPLKDLQERRDVWFISSVNLSERTLINYITDALDQRNINQQGCSLRGWQDVETFTHERERWWDLLNKLLFSKSHHTAQLRLLHYKHIIGMSHKQCTINSLIGCFIGKNSNKEVTPERKCMTSFLKSPNHEWINIKCLFWY